MLSVIIPAYNCADTLPTAVESALSCCCDEDIEVIIVDDGSTDNTPKIIGSLAQNEPRLNCFRIENSGPAGARNAGLQAARGDYIMFLDSDDEFLPGAIETVKNEARDCDMLIFGFKQTFEGRAKPKVYSSDSDEIDALYRGNLLNSVWNKAFKRDFLENYSIMFKPYKYGEDRLFVADCLCRSPILKVIPQVLYNYKIDNSTSLISGYVPKKFTACKKIYNRFSALCSHVGTAEYMLIKNILSCFTVLFADNCPLNYNEKQKEVEIILRDEALIAPLEIKQRGVGEILRLIIKSGSVKINYSFAHFVAICQKKLLPLFLKFRG